MPRRVAKRTKIVTTEGPIQRRWTLEEGFQEFLRAKRLEQVKRRTIEDHENHFRYWRSWLTEAHPDVRYVEEVSGHVLRNYIDYMLNEHCKWETHPIVTKSGTGLSPVTVNIRLRTLKCWFRWFQLEGMSTENPAVHLSFLRTEEDTIRGLSVEEVALLLAQPDLSTYVGFRDYALMLLLLDVGSRISETLLLLVSDIDWSNQTVCFPSRVTKTRKTKTVPLSSKVAGTLAELVDENRANFGDKNPLVFLTEHGAPLHPDVIRPRITQYGKRAGIDGCRVSPHTFRHTFGRLYIRNGGDIFTLQKILGHKSLEMVRRYVQMEQDDVRDAHSKFSPLNQLKF